MADVRPFRALRPADSLAGEVIAPPYDVLSEAEARMLATPKSFLHITRSEVDLSPGTDAHSAAAYAKARENLDFFQDQGWLLEDTDPAYYLYTLKMGTHLQSGFLALCSVEEYDNGRIAKHEFTRPDKEDDLVKHMEALDAQVGLVFLAYRQSDTLAAVIERSLSIQPLWTVTTDDGVQHTLRRVTANDEIRTAFLRIERLYIADGHHRSAAASRVHAARQTEASSTFLAGLFPEDQLQILAYNRVVHDFNGKSVDDFIASVEQTFDLTLGEPRPQRAGQFSMFLGDRWYFLTLKPKVKVPSDPVSQLDASVLQDHLLAPILGIEDPRRSNRSTFIGGIRGPEALEQSVRQGNAVAFHLFPTSLSQLFAVADAGQVMPPKSTWFEPKLREGVVSRRL